MQSIFKLHRSISSIEFFAALAIVLSRFTSWVQNPSGVVLPDSASYLPNSWLDFGQVSFLGESTRGWVVPLVYSVLPSPELRVGFQYFFGTLTWCLVILLVKQIASNQMAFRFTLLLIVVIACSPQVIQFEGAFLATSFLINFTVLYIFAILYLCKTKNFSPRNLLMLSLLAWVCVSLKITNFFLIPLMGIVAITFLKQHKFRKVLLAFLILNFVLQSQALFSGLQNDKYWQYSYSGTAIMWHLGVQSPGAKDFKNYLVKQGAPKCILQNAPYRNISLELANISLTCPESGKYISHRIGRDLAKFLLTNPFATVKILSTGLGIAFTGTASNYAQAISVLPPGASNLIFGNVQPDFRTMGISDQNALADSTNEPLWIFSPGLFLVFVGLLLAVRRFRTQQNLIFVLIMMALLMLVAATVLILPSEWFRQNINLVVPLYLTSMLSLSTNVQRRL